MVGSVTSDWLTTDVLNHASIHSDTAVVSAADVGYCYRVLRAICCQPVDGSLICFM